MLLNKKEKEKRIIELYNQGKTIREIAKEVHMSFKDISSTIKSYTGEGHEDKSKISLSKDTQAIKMFSQNKTPIDMTTELNLKVNHVEKIYKNYWKLKGLYKLYNLYEEHIENDFPSFLKLYKIIKEEAVG